MCYFLMACTPTNPEFIVNTVKLGLVHFIQNIIYILQLSTIATASPVPRPTQNYEGDTKAF